MGGALELYNKPAMAMTDLFEDSPSNRHDGVYLAYHFLGRHDGVQCHVYLVYYWKNVESNVIKGSKELCLAMVPLEQGSQCQPALKVDSGRSTQRPLGIPVLNWHYVYVADSASNKCG